MLFFNGFSDVFAIRLTNGAYLSFPRYGRGADECQVSKDVSWNSALQPLPAYPVHSAAIFDSMLLIVYFQLVVFAVQQVTRVGHNPVYERIKIGRVTPVLFICMHTTGSHNYADLWNFIQLMVMLKIWESRSVWQRRLLFFHYCFMFSVFLVILQWFLFCICNGLNREFVWYLPIYTFIKHRKNITKIVIGPIKRHCLLLLRTEVIGII